MTKLKRDRILARHIVASNVTPGILQNKRNILNAIMGDMFELWLWSGHIELAVRVPSGLYHLAIKL